MVMTWDFYLLKKKKNQNDITCANYYKVNETVDP